MNFMDCEKIKITRFKKLDELENFEENCRRDKLLRSEFIGHVTWHMVPRVFRAVDHELPFQDLSILLFQCQVAEGDLQLPDSP